MSLKRKDSKSTQKKKKQKIINDAELSLKKFEFAEYPEWYDNAFDAEVDSLTTVEFKRHLVKHVIASHQYFKDKKKGVHLSLLWQSVRNRFEDISLPPPKLLLRSFPSIFNVHEDGIVYLRDSSLSASEWNSQNATANNVPLDNNQTPLDKEQIPLDNEQIPFDKEKTPLDNEKIPLDNEKITLDNEQTSLENEQATLNNEGHSEQSISLDCLDEHVEQIPDNKLKETVKRFVDVLKEKALLGSYTVPLSQLVSLSNSKSTEPTEKLKGKGRSAKSIVEGHPDIFILSTIKASLHVSLASFRHLKNTPIENGKSGRKLKFKQVFTHTLKKVDGTFENLYSTVTNKLVSQIEAYVSYMVADNNLVLDAEKGFNVADDKILSIIFPGASWLTKVQALELINNAISHYLIHRLQNKITDNVTDTIDITDVLQNILKQ
eukprot:GHVL01042707.1.p2 GENE.GHVL01042707.1~~GHVL01042707.1.p2  ORF type:complete len:448 (-),score=95.26 GHVL01042707.1:1931-3232(-)